MADIFYQGEDIAMTLEFFEDEAMNEVMDLENIDVDMLFYVKNSTPITGSTESDSDSDIVIIKSDDNKKLMLVIPASKTKTLSTGLLNCEIRVINNETNEVKITCSNSIRIESSKIGLL